MENNNTTNSTDISTTMAPDTTTTTAMGTTTTTAAPDTSTTTAAQITTTQNGGNSSENSTVVYGFHARGRTIRVGNYYGWETQISYPGLRRGTLGFPDIYVQSGDTIQFVGRGFTSDDVWLMDDWGYENCNFTYATQLAPNSQLNSDDFPDGFKFYINPVLYKPGDVLLFASGRYWTNPTHYWNSCVNWGMKVRVIVYESTLIPIIENDNIGIPDQETIDNLQSSIAKIGRVLILNQFAAEQRVRTRGQSGLTNVRGTSTGDYAYHDGTYSNGAAASIHNHADTIRVVGIGEVEACLNGVCFQTRHNDYNLNMPSTVSSNYHATEAILQPGVPPEVTSKSTVTEQITEMQEWFRAFKNQDHSVRDYRQYFKPILCVLEGTYILDTNTLNDGFDSDRHQLDASTWESLHSKVRWMANSGRKSSAENLAHLPGVLRYLQNDTWPVVSNWEYRIICQPLKNDIPTSRFKIEDDLHIQIQSSPKTRDELYYDRRARFKLNTFINLDDLDDHRWSSSPTEWNYLDYLMEQVPGKDNFGCQITDTLPDGSEPTIQYNSFTNTTLNSCYYSRYYRILNDDKGSSSHRRSYSDQYMFAAQTTQAKVSPIKFDFEIKNDNGTSSYYPTESKWSYAIPLEIIYLTPLHQWNPYNIIYNEVSNPEDGGRTGICSQGTSRALLGSNRANYFRTPVEFFASTESQYAADTSGGATCVLDSTNTVREVRASGHWITFPEIGGGVGEVRQRYPIFPIHEAGSATWKEIKALQQIVLKEGYDDITSEDLSDFFGPLKDIRYGFSLLLTGGGSHQHEMYIPGSKIEATWYNATSKDYIYFDSFDNNVIKEDTEWRNGHTHTLDVSRKWNATNNAFVYKIIQCRWGDLQDNDIGYTSNICADGHNAVSRY